MKKMILSGLLFLFGCNEKLEESHIIGLWKDPGNTAISVEFYSDGTFSSKGIPVGYYISSHEFSNRSLSGDGRSYSIDGTWYLSHPKQGKDFVHVDFLSPLSVSKKDSLCFYLMSDELWCFDGVPFETDKWLTFKKK